MANCPLCGKEIDHLDLEEERTIVGSVAVEDGRLAYDEEGTPVIDTKYMCPECALVVAESEDEVKVILGVE
ncbi:hypothetical protein ES703_46280 [subsurface metagenome]